MRSEVVDVADVVLEGRKSTRDRRRTHAVLAELHAKLGTRPGQEGMWPGLLRERANAKGLAERLEVAFRPEHPRAWLPNPRMWLSNFDIANVLDQYRVSHGPLFAFLGVFPVDFAQPIAAPRLQRNGAKGGVGGFLDRLFPARANAPKEPDCVSPRICRTTLAELRHAGHREFGAVFNLDRHDQGGTHWVSMYGGLDPRDRARYGLYYCDSTGKPPPEEIAAFMRRLALEERAASRARGADGKLHKGPRFMVRHNRLQRQFENTECGVYSMAFIVACLTTRHSYANIVRELMAEDPKMFQLRSVFFRPPGRKPNGVKARHT
jgi:hypothetical protein